MSIQFVCVWPGGPKQDDGLRNATERVIERRASTLLELTVSSNRARRRPCAFGPPMVNSVASSHAHRFASTPVLRMPSRTKNRIRDTGCDENRRNLHSAARRLVILGVPKHAGLYKGKIHGHGGRTRDGWGAREELRKKDPTSRPPPVRPFYRSPPTLTPGRTPFTTAYDVEENGRCTSQDAMRSSATLCCWQIRQIFGQVSTNLCVCVCRTSLPHFGPM